MTIHAEPMKLYTREERDDAIYFRDLVRSVSCPSCDARAGELCFNTITQTDMSSMVPGHIARAREAQQ